MHESHVAFDGWVLDATQLDAEQIDAGLFSWIPMDVEAKEVLPGRIVISPLPPGRFLGVVHAAGLDAVEAWCTENRNTIEAIRAGIASKGA